MTEVTGVDAAVRDHARRIVSGDASVLSDLAAEAVIDPPDLIDRLLHGVFRRFDVVAHARIGTYHIFKTRYVGPTTLVVQARWIPVSPDGWRLAEAEIARVAVDEGA